MAGSWRIVHSAVGTSFLVWYPGVAGITPLRIGTRGSWQNGGIGLNITTADLVKLREIKELEETFSVLSAEDVNGLNESASQHYRAWQKSKGTRKGYRYNSNNVGSLTRMKGLVRMTWKASLTGKGEIVAEADTLDALLEALMSKTLPDNTEVTILHV